MKESWMFAYMQTNYEVKWIESGTAYIVWVTLAKYVCKIQCAMY